MMQQGEKLVLKKAYNFIEICEGFKYTETVPAGTSCEYLGNRKKERFIPEHRLKQKYVDGNWNVANDEGLKLPVGHLVYIPLNECGSGATLTVNDEFIEKYFLEDEANERF